MTVRLMHINHLENLYIYFGVKCQFGVIWGHWGPKVIFTKML